MRNASFLCVGTSANQGVKRMVILPIADDAAGRYNKLENSL